jgi:hypothetical protein
VISSPSLIQHWSTVPSFCDKMARRNKRRARGLPQHASVVPLVPPAATSFPVVDETMVGVAEVVPVIFLSDDSNEDTDLAVAPPEEVNSDVLGNAISLACLPLEERIKNHPKTPNSNNHHSTSKEKALTTTTSNVTYPTLQSTYLHQVPTNHRKTPTSNVQSISQ